MAATVKAHFLKGEQADTIRRFSMPASEGPGLYETLKAKARSLFPQLQNEDFDLYWKDDEGDLVTFSSDAELSDGYSHADKDVFKIYMKQKGGCQKAQAFGPMWETHGPAQIWGPHMMHKPHGWGQRAWWRHAMSGRPCQKRAARCQADWEVNDPKQKCSDPQSKDGEGEKLQVESDGKEMHTSDDAMHEGDDVNAVQQHCRRGHGHGHGHGRGRGLGGCGRGGRARRWAAWMQYMSEMSAAADGGDDAAKQQQQFMRQFYQRMAGQAETPPEQEGKTETEGCHPPSPPPCMGMGPPWLRHMYAQYAAMNLDKDPETETETAPNQEPTKDESEADKMEQSDENNKESAPEGKGKGAKWGRRGRGGRGGRFWRMSCGMPREFMMSQHHGDQSEMAQMWAMYGGQPGLYAHHMADHPFRGMRGQFMKNYRRQMMREQGHHMGCGMPEHDTVNPESPTEENYIDEMVQRLEAMGFHNPDGYLAGLVLENEGNMEKVLDQLRKDQ